MTYEPHPLYPPLLKRKGGCSGFEGTKPLQASLNEPLSMKILKYIKL